MRRVGVGVVDDDVENVDDEHDDRLHLLPVATTTVVVVVVVVITFCVFVCFGEVYFLLLLFYQSPSFFCKAF